MKTLQEIFETSAAIEDIKSILVKEYAYSLDPEKNAFEVLFNILLSHIKAKGALVPSGFFPYSVPLPSKSALREINVILDQESLDKVWMRDGILSWAYQHFVSDKKGEAFENILKKNTKISSSLIAPATQIFTPDWIVDYLLENTLARFWLEMHSDSRIADDLKYFVNANKLGSRSLKSVIDIRFIDPACGTMNFGIKAFDLFCFMYREEADRSGTSGWPDKKPFSDLDEIPSLILNNNIFGLDIDPNAIKVAKASLELKAMSLSPGVDPTDENIVCAAGSAFDLGKLGSLARFTDEDVKDIFEGDKYGENIKQAAKILTQSYDVVATNPPFLGRRNWTEEMRLLLKEKYPKYYMDLYSCFISRCMELAGSEGFIGMLTMCSFMFTGSFKHLRDHILDEMSVESLLHLGSKAFRGQYGDKINTCAFVMKKDAKNPEEGVFFQLTDPDYDGKKDIFLKELSAIALGEKREKVFSRRKEDFIAAPAHSLVYWISDDVRKLFTGRRLDDVAFAAQGLATTDNSRFLRYWWEVDRSEIGGKWVPYMKGSGGKRWYGNHKFLVDWENEGEAIKLAVKEKYPYLKGDHKWVVKNSDRYFSEGITYSFLAMEDFNVRYLPKGFIFDVSGSSVFPEEADLHDIMAVLGSKAAPYFLSILNPTVNHQAGDVARIPFPYNPAQDTASLWEEARKIVSECIKIMAEEERNDITSLEFDKLPDWNSGLRKSRIRANRVLELENKLSDIVFQIFGFNSEIVDEINASSKRRSSPAKALTEKSLAVRHLTYALGEVLDTDGFIVTAPDAAGDAVKRVFEVLKKSVGEASAKEIVDVLGGDISGFLRKDFFLKHHVSMYKKRPIFWQLRSEDASFSVYILHSKADASTLSRLYDKEIAPRLTGGNNSLDGFARQIKSLINLGVSHSSDDGILINMAPFHKLIRWGEPGKYFKALVGGRYSWSGTFRSKIAQKLAKSLE